MIDLLQPVRVSMPMMTPDLDWACQHIPLFKEFKAQVDRVKESEREYRKRFEGCPRPAKKAGIPYGLVEAA